LFDREDNLAMLYFAVSLLINFPGKECHEISHTAYSDADRPWETMTCVGKKGFDKHEKYIVMDERHCIIFKQQTMR
jgi:hypothetical protein